jgi:hypothetical protein
VHTFALDFFLGEDRTFLQHRSDEVAPESGSAGWCRDDFTRACPGVVWP